MMREVCSELLLALIALNDQVLCAVVTKSSYHGGGDNSK